MRSPKWDSLGYIDCLRPDKHLVDAFCRLPQTITTAKPMEEA